LAFMMVFSSASQAHPARLASGVAKIDRAGNVSITLNIDLLAFVLNDTPARVSDVDMRALLDERAEALQAQLDDATDRLLHSTQIKDGRIDSVTFPNAVSIEAWKHSSREVRLPVMMEVTLAGKLASDATSFSIKFPEALDSLVLTVETPDAEPRAFALEPDQWSPEFPLARPTTTAAQSAAPGRVAVALRFMRLGFEHILPRGRDHILFILGLFLLSPKLKPLLWQVSAFTIAHSITLGLALYGIVRLPSNIVEPIIAGSIAFVAVENLLTPKLKPWRPVVVFAFGLIHGMGFAGVLLDMSLPRRDFATALVSFNVGVELGQIAVVMLALLAVGWFRKRTWYRQAIVMPASAVIAATGIVWMIRRL
jgi:hypothetical protein